MLLVVDAAFLQVMQQEIHQQGAALAKLEPLQQQTQKNKAISHAALAMSSVSFPSVAPASPLTAHPGDVLQVE
jgi:hypothetical protein